MSAYYNEFDAKKAAWLRELIAQNLIAPGDVDERSIADVRPADLRGYTQCHWFAGVAVWSYALRLAGWPDDRPVWTGSCPCPSFSVAGKGEGFSDPRHLWPDWYRLIRESKPPAVFGEQSDAAIGHGWLDLVQADMEAEDYAIGKAVLGACSVGAPHRRQRLYFVADALAQSASSRHDHARKHGGGSSPLPARSEQRGGTRDMADGSSQRLSERSIEADRADRVERSERLRVAGELENSHSVLAEQPSREWARPAEANGGRSRSEFAGRSAALSMADSLLPERWSLDGREQDGRDGSDRRRTEARGEPGTLSEVRGLDDGRRPGPVNGFWRDADWIFCTDGKWRAVRPGSQPLASGSPARVGRLRGYGDAITAQVAAAFIAAYMEATA